MRKEEREDEQVRDREFRLTVKREMSLQSLLGYWMADTNNEKKATCISFNDYFELIAVGYDKYRFCTGMSLMTLVAMWQFSMCCHLSVM